MFSDILDKFTTHLKSALAKSYALAVEMGSASIEPEHVLLALLLQKGSVGGEMLHKANISPEEIRRLLRYNQTENPSTDAVPKLSSETKRAIEKSVLTANVNEHKYIGTEHLLCGLLDIGSPAIEAILTEQNIDIIELKEQVVTMMKSTSKFPEITETFETGHTPKKDELKAEKKSDAKKKHAAQAKTPGLDFFAIDLTSPKAQEKIDPVIGRETEIERLVQILCRRTKNNPALLGEPGVGKTAIVEGLAKRIVEGNVPEVLQGKRILSLDLGLMLAGTIYRGEFEGRIKQVVDEVKANPDIIVFIDELHNIMGAGSTSGSLDAANILKPALARGDLHCIGATTLAEFKKHIESDGALERRFQSIIVDQPTPENAIKILQGLREHYEGYHGVTITDEAIEAAVTLSERYMADRFLPDKAIDLIDEAAACVRVNAAEHGENKKLKSLQEDLAKLQKKKQKAVIGENFIEALELKTKEKEIETEIAAIATAHKTQQKTVVGKIGRAEIAGVIARATKIPVTELLLTEKDRLLHLEDHLQTRVVGQEEAIKAVSEMVRRAKAGIAHPNRPLASFLFLGPSGVGKTELAKTLADIVFKDPDALVRIDMSEFSEGFNMSKLVGAPAGYVGYKESTKLSDVIKRKPHALVLFDEIEKAHGDVHNLLLQVLDDGHLTDATGKKINFKNTIIIMTSNVGSSVLQQPAIGFADTVHGVISTQQKEETKNEMIKELERSFRPEFINRIDKVVVFHPLSQKDLESIVALQLKELSDRVSRDYDVSLMIMPETLAYIAEKSWNPLYGARGVRRQIQELVENELAKELLAEHYRASDTVVVSVADGAITLTVAKKKSPSRAMAA